jgi:hypothetical protein
MISDQDVSQLAVCAQRLPRDRRHDVYDDSAGNLFLMVLDMMMHVTTVTNSLAFYRHNARAQVYDLPTLKGALARFADDRVGNTNLAQYLWGNNHWTRAETLRRLVPFFESGVTDQDALVGWARSAEFRRDFEGRVKGLGYTTFQWLTMRCGIETVKPDVHTRRFTQRCLGRPLTDSDIVELVTRAAKLLGMPARSLDLAIWERESGKRELDSRTDPGG